MKWTMARMRRAGGFMGSVEMPLDDLGEIRIETKAACPNAPQPFLVELIVRLG
jgi:hypothetical protein